MKLVEARNSNEVRSGAFDLFPKEIIFHIASYLDRTAQSALVASCYRFYGLFQEKRLADAHADELLLAAIRCETDKISAMLLAHPYLLLEKGSAKDDVNLPFHCTPLEYLFWVGDGYTSRRLVEHLLTLANNEQSSELKQRINEYIQKLSSKETDATILYRASYSQHIANYLPHGSQQPLWTKAQRRAAIRELDKLDPDSNAIARRNAYLNYIDNFVILSEEEREQAKQKIIALESKGTGQDVFYDLIPVAEAYQKYIENFNPFMTEYNKRFWREVIGFMQCRIPRHYIYQSYSQSLLAGVTDTVSHAREQQRLLAFFREAGVLLGGEVITAGFDLCAFVPQFEEGMQKCLELKKSLRNASLTSNVSLPHPF